MVDIDKDGGCLEKLRFKKLLLVQNDINVIARRNGIKTNSQYSLKLTESSNLIYWIQRFTSEQFASENVSTLKIQNSARISPVTFHPNLQSKFNQ